MKTLAPCPLFEVEHVLWLSLIPSTSSIFHETGSDCDVATETVLGDALAETEGRAEEVGEDEALGIRLGDTEALDNNSKEVEEGLGTELEELDEGETDGEGLGAGLEALTEDEVEVEGLGADLDGLIEEETMLESFSCSNLSTSSSCDTVLDALTEGDVETSCDFSGECDGDGTESSGISSGASIKVIIVGLGLLEALGVGLGLLDELGDGVGVELVEGIADFEELGVGLLV